MPVTLVLHSTQGGTAAGAQATLDAIQAWPHDILSPPEDGLIIPCIPHYQNAKALFNEPGGIEPNNRGGVLQVELVGFANRETAEYYGYTNSKYIVPEWGDYELGIVADYIIKCHLEDGLPIVFPRSFISYPASYGTGNGVRYSHAEWAAVEGIIGHQHVPENYHGDPGALDITRLNQIIVSKLPSREEDMVLLVPNTGIKDGVFTYNGSHVRWIRSGIELDVLKRQGVTQWIVSLDEITAIFLTVGKVGPSPDSGHFAGAW